MSIAAPTHVEFTSTGVGVPDHVADPVHSSDLRYTLRRGGLLDEVPEFRWTWSSPDPVNDLVRTADVVRLVSPRVRELYEALLGPEDQIQWLPGTVHHPDGTDHQYWVVHFPVHHDLLDRDRSTFGPSGLPIHYVFSQAKLAGHAITAQPRRAATTIVSTTVADALHEMGATGAAFMNLEITP